MPRPSIRYVWIAPHADDELLSMGAAIHEHIQAHGPESVAVVLAGTGESSGARRALRDAGYVPPGVDGVQRVALTKREFVASRDAEFYESCRALGVPHGHIYMPGFALREDDGSVYRRGSYTTGSIPRLARMCEGWGLPAAQRFVDAVAGWFGPDVHYKTMSHMDPSMDHRLLGAALRRCRLPLGSRRFYFPPYRLGSLPKGAPQMYGGDARAAWLPALHAAGMAYGRWDPVQGRFAVGWLSVGAFFGGPAASMLRCPSRVPLATRVEECGRVGSVAAPNVPFFGHARTVMHL